ncbi:hypothetical protein WICPIJ_007159 [Wickerhamomyces pijperi]|uniref:Uncharacterized protein n=1 Tax=Wickerhamomyces pijperi TaxID=599730 RepID=A0A9P8Q0E0_WICPI|nr:hypothetical protein WICPIJ_007159 [Wickerhamomyces pijperi]
MVNTILSPSTNLDTDFSSWDSLNLQTISSAQASLIGAQWALKISESQWDKATKSSDLLTICCVINSTSITSITAWRSLEGNSVTKMSFKVVNKVGILEFS